MSENKNNSEGIEKLSSNRIRKMKTSKEVESIAAIIKGEGGMYVTELIYPGTWLDYEDEDWVFEVQKIIGSIESQLIEATLALGLFEREQSCSRMSLKEEWEADVPLRQKIIEKYQKEYGEEGLYQNISGLLELTDLELRQERWKAGQLPRSYQHHLIFMYAKAFLYSLDMLSKLIRVLSEKEGIPKEINEISQSFTSRFPSLKGVRDSEQHIEDRVRGLGRKQKQLKLKPVNNSLIKADGGVLALGNLNGNKFGSTMADGHYGEVEVSIDSLNFVRDSIQKILDSFNWRGSKRFYPS